MFLSGMLARGRTGVKMALPPALARAIRWVPAVLWMGSIFYLSHQASPLGSLAEATSDRLAHVSLYTGLALTLYWALARPTSNGSGAPAWVPVAIAFALTVLYGVTDELHQAFVPGRVASEADLASNAIGALIGVIAASLVAVLLRHNAQGTRKSR